MYAHVLEHNCHIFKLYVYNRNTDICKENEAKVDTLNKPVFAYKCWEKTTHFCSMAYCVLQFIRVITFVITFCTFIWVLQHSYTAGSLSQSLVVLSYLEIYPEAWVQKGEHGTLILVLFINTF